MAARVRQKFNELLRQYVPKGGDIDAFSEEHIQQIQDKFNQPLSRLLGYKRPQHASDSPLKRVALQG